MGQHKGIVLNTSFDMMIAPKRLSNGLIKTGVVISETIDQEVATVLKLSQGDLKEDPLLGAGLNKFIRGQYKSSQIEHRIRQQLNLAGINYDEYKEKINTTINPSK